MKSPKETKETSKLELRSGFKSPEALKESRSRFLSGKGSPKDSPRFLSGKGSLKETAPKEQRRGSDEDEGDEERKRRIAYYRPLMLPSGETVDITKRNKFIREWTEKRVKCDPRPYYLLAFATVLLMILLYVYNYHQAFLLNLFGSHKSRTTPAAFKDASPDGYDYDDDYHD